MLTLIRELKDVIPLEKKSYRNAVFNIPQLIFAYNNEPVPKAK